MTGLKLKEGREITYLNKDEVERFLKVIKSARDKAIFTVMYYRGLRASELGLLTIKDIRLGDNRILIHRLKRSITGTVHLMSPAESKAIKGWLKIRLLPKWVKRWGDTILFPSNRGKPIDRVTLYGLVGKYGKLAKLPKEKCHPHIFKHSIATNLLESGEDIMTVQDWLGHKDIRNTLLYAKVTNKRREDAAKRFYANSSTDSTNI